MENLEELVYQTIKNNNYLKINDICNVLNADKKDVMKCIRKLKKQEKIVLKTIYLSNEDNELDFEKSPFYGKLYVPIENYQAIDKYGRLKNVLPHKCNDSSHLIKKDYYWYYDGDGVYHIEKIIDNKSYKDSKIIKAFRSESLDMNKMEKIVDEYEEN